MKKTYTITEGKRRAVINGQVLKIMGDDGKVKECWNDRYWFEDSNYRKLKRWADNWALRCKLPKIETKH